MDSGRRTNASRDKQAAPVNPPGDAQAAEPPAVASGSPPEAGVGRFPVVGIGASAGGLEALKEFFSAMPADSGMAFVIVQHLEPSHESRMAEILAKCTTMKVVQAESDMPVRPNAVYTNPPGRTLSLHGARLVLGKSTQGAHVEAAIDHFLVSLAEDHGSSAICIILSGSSGSDGPRGLRAVRAAGGMCMAQDPATAQFAPMPQAAIDTGLVDYILGPAQMPAALLEFLRHPQIQAASREEPPTGGDAASDLEAILKLLQVRTSGDYRHYKQTTVLRRIQRRMALRQTADMRDYLRLLQKDADEVVQLSKDMLIGVSAFFRDAGVFDTLRREVMVPLVESRQDGLPLRAWVPGCASGEEAYSIAMLLLEVRAAAGTACPVQVFATDVDEQALEKARAGAYPLSIAADVSAERLEAFFTKRGAAWQVNKHLREAVVFSRHNLLTDPPFSKLDLVSCRNVLIYLEPAAQKKVLTVFSFAINVGGHLLLGKSEGVTGMESLFDAVSKPNRLYRLLRSNRRAAGEFPPYAAGRQAPVVDRDRATGDASVLARANLGALLKHFNAGVVLVDPAGTIMYLHGSMGKFLGLPKGVASMNILDMTGGTLSARLRRAIDGAMQQDEPIHLAHVPLPEGRSPLVNLTVMRVAERLAGGLLAILFEEAHPPHPPTVAQSVPAEDEPLVAQLEAEVKALRGELRSSAEGYDAAAEELKAANEEVMSMNEELQSANEELEASKEELQSINEELTTVNSQLNEKVNELTDTNNDLANLLMATQIATLFLDSQLRIKRYTPSATTLLNLMNSDLGRPVSHITQNFTGIDLVADAAEVLASLAPQEKEVRHRDGGWYTLRILPYRTLDNRIDGVVITFSDVSRLKEAEDLLRHQKVYAEGIVETVRHPLLVLDGQLRVLSANTTFYGSFQTRPDQTIGHRVYDLGGGEWNIPDLRALLEQVIPKESAFEDFRLEQDFPQIGRRVVLLSGRRIETAGDEAERILLAVEDVTERERAREELGALNLDLEKRVVDRTALADHRSAQLRSLAVKLARSEQRERQRLAQMLHDNLQQLLVGAKFQLAALRAPEEGDSRVEAIDLMESLLNQSLEASRSLTVELSPTILYETGLDAALLWLARQMKAKHGLEVQTDIRARLVQDEDGVVVLLFHAVRELLLNVVKHAGVRLARVALDRVDGDWVRIVVSDQGQGFDPAKTREDEDSATGLGLFGMCERMGHIGGSCDIDSTPGGGTRVTLLAKVGRPKESPKTTAAVPHPVEEPATVAVSSEQSRPRIRVLLADDHAMVRQGLAGILGRQEDIEVVAEACNGQQAVEMARETHPDVVVMDASMPVLNGLEATRAIVSLFPGTRVVGLSMFDEADGGEAMREAGAVAYLSKGGPSEDLLAAVRAAAGRDQNQ